MAKWFSSDEYLIYETMDFTNIKEGPFATYDAIANIASQLSQNGLNKGVDWELTEVGINTDAQQEIQIEFRRSEDAMLIKIKGLEKVRG